MDDFCDAVAVHIAGCKPVEGEAIERPEAFGGALIVGREDEPCFGPVGG